MKWNEIERILKENIQREEMEFDDSYWNEMETMLDERAEFSTTEYEALRQTLEAESPEFQEVYWDEMKGILDKNDRRKRHLFLVRFASEIAAGLLLVLYSYFSNEPPHYSEILSQRDPSTVRTINSGINTEKTDGNVSIHSNAADALNSLGVTERSALGQSNSAMRVEKFVAQEYFPRDPEPTRITPTEASPSSVAALHVREAGPVTTSLSYLPPVEQPAISASNAKRKGFNGNLDISALAGVGMVTAPKGNVENRGHVGVTGFIGFDFGYHHKNWLFQLGTEVNYRTGINHELRYEKTVYGTRLYKQSDIVQYSGITRIELPVSIHLTRNRNRFGLGCSPVWNVAFNSNYHHYNSYTHEEFYVRNNLGIREGMNPFDVRMHLYYQRILNPSLIVGYRMSFGFIDQVDHSKFVNTQGMHEASGSLFIKYTIVNF